jgi:hypothetical protein
MCYLVLNHAEFVQKPPAKRSKCVVIGVGVGSDVTKSHRVVGGRLQLAAQEHACGVAVHQNGQQRSGVMGLGATACVLAGEVGEVELIDDFNHEARQVIFIEPILHRRGRRKSVLRSATMKCDMEGIAHLDSLYFNRIAIKSGAVAGGIYYDKDRQAARA